jgi:hypothetical protein
MGRGADTQLEGSTDALDVTAMSKGTVGQRRTLVAARKNAARERDAARIRLAGELARGAQRSIPRERGFLVVSPGALEGTADLIATTNDVIDSIGHDRLMSGKTKGGFLARGFLPDEAMAPDSPYLRFALGEDVIGPIAAYLGVVPVLTEFDVWYSAHGPNSPRSSQLWHLDPADTTQVKVWVHCSDVGEDSGPLTIVDATASDQLADWIGYRYDEEHYRVPDDTVRDFAGEKGIVPLAGPSGTVAFVDTSMCFHFGSRVSAGAPPRRMVLLQYLTPYAFDFVSDHREEAPLRGLATAGSSELERLVLGAA